MSFKKNPLKTGGKSLYINTKTKKDQCPIKFQASLSNISQKARDFCDEAEWFYYLKAKEKFINSEAFGWHNLSLQEKKVINGLDEFKIPAYLGYRYSFKAHICFTGSR